MTGVEQAVPGRADDPEQRSRRREQKAWNWYDWANSAYFTTIGTVLFGPWMIHVARQAAPDCRTPGCVQTVDVLGLHLAAGSLPGYLTGFATVIGAFALPIVGAFVDRSPHKKRHMAAYAWVGSLFAASLFFLDHGRWQLGAVAIVMSNILVGCSLVAYNAILVDISTEDERDRTSSRGWAWGYLGGGLLLAINLAVVTLHTRLGLSEGFAVRVSMLSAAAWWSAFTLIPFLRLRNHPTRNLVDTEGGLFERSFGQLFTTLRELRGYPMTLTFLIAYLFYNDGIQTVITSASVYGAEQLKLSQQVLIAAILMIQFVAFGGALLFGRLAGAYGAYRSILAGTFAWMLLIVAAYFLPVGRVVPFLVLGIGVAIVLGGTQALSRSFFSLLIPRGREGEYFSLYQACERGTSWLGAVLFAVMFQLTGSYRPAIIALISFFVIGAVFLLRLDPVRGIREAGNQTPNDRAERPV
ncbi:MAG TPA: MFS transporter [Nocardioidaceae bacterium]|nr:MFS transporter [Nocardioidaceae bacterium]